LNYFSAEISLWINNYGAYSFLFALKKYIGVVCSKKRNNKTPKVVIKMYTENNENRVKYENFRR